MAPTEVVAWIAVQCHQENQLEIYSVSDLKGSSWIIYGMRPLGVLGVWQTTWLGLVSICSSIYLESISILQWEMDPWVSLVQGSLLFIKPSKPTISYAAGQSVDCEFASIAS